MTNSTIFILQIVAFVFVVGIIGQTVGGAV